VYAAGVRPGLPGWVGPKSKPGLIFTKSVKFKPGFDFMAHYLLFYDFVPDYLERRGEFRNEHLALAWEAHDRGELVLGGAYAEPADGAALLFNAESPAAAERFVEADPYVRHGLVTRWRVRKWTTVAGAMATTPVKPE
jgi:uncharacterized protein